jgi:small GTP-binding protein
VGDVLAQLGDDAAEDRKRLQQNAADLQDMFFLVVVVGEFNAGKSSFINALLGDELLPMGITPTTDAIELVRWSNRRSKEPTWREAGIVREWAHPNTGGPGVVIVDTPGTGSVFRKHEQIAKNFLSRSDLVIFLLSAKRALAETERLYLELARDYGKKIVVVINQTDLLEKRAQGGSIVRAAAVARITRSAP